MKKLIVLLNIFLWAYQLYAQENLHACVQPCIFKDSVSYQQKQADSILVVVGRFLTPVIFDVNRYRIRTTPQLKDAIDSILKSPKTLARIWIKGSASPEGSSEWNRKLGQYRSEALADYIVRETGLDYSLFHICNLGEDWKLLEEALEKRPDFPNRERIQAILSEEQDNEIRKQKIGKLDGGKTWRRLIDELFPPLRNARMAIVSAYPKQLPIASGITREMRPVVPMLPCDLLPKTIPTTVSKPKDSKWSIAIKNNLLFDLLLVANLGLEVSPWTHWSFDIPVWYSPYDISSTRNIRLLAVQPEIRWWSKKAMVGHFVGLHTHVAGFNIALNDDTRYQDPNHALWGLGLSYGYALSLGKSKHWGLEFTIGAGFARYQYDAYRNENNGQKFKSGSGCYWGITRAGVTLSYKWILSKKNRKNGES